MIIKKLICSNTMKDDNGSDFTIEYFITETKGILNDAVSPYGISVEKSTSNGSSDVYLASACFKREANAKLLLQKLSKYSVTPVLAEDAVDLLIGKGY